MTSGQGFVGTVICLTSQLWRLPWPCVVAAVFY